MKAAAASCASLCIRLFEWCIVLKWNLLNFIKAHKKQVIVYQVQLTIRLQICSHTATQNEHSRVIFYKWLSEVDVGAHS